MVDRTGLHTAPVPGNPPLGTAPVDGRIVQAALFGSLGQCLNGGGLTPSATNMAFPVAAGVYQIPATANGGAVYHSPVDSATVTPAAGQAGGRIDSLYVLQQDFEKNGTTSRVVYGLQAGVVGSGVAPSLSGIAGGPLRLANITVPAAATKATDCTVAWVVPPATLALDGATAASKALLDLMPGSYVGQRSFAGGIDYRWMGSFWKPWDSDWIAFTPTFTVGTQTQYSKTGKYRYRGGTAVVEATVTFDNGGTIPNADNYLALPFNVSPTNAYLGPARVIYTNASNGYRQHEGVGEIDSNSQRLYLKALNNSGIQYPGVHDQIGGTCPFAEAWGQSDGIGVHIEYDPA